MAQSVAAECVGEGGSSTDEQRQGPRNVYLLDAAIAASVALSKAGQECVWAMEAVKVMPPLEQL
jgi:hypothetical protein